MKYQDVTYDEKIKAFKFRNKYFKNQTSPQVKELCLNSGLRIIYNEFNMCLNLCSTDFPLLFGMPQEYITVSLANKVIKEIGLNKNKTYYYTNDKFKE
jgi:hypothetical protein